MLFECNVKELLMKNSVFRYLQDRDPEDTDTSAVSINRVKFKTLQKSFQTIGFKSQEICSVYSILAGILHTGNVTFTEKEKKHQTYCTVENRDLLKIGGHANDIQMFLREAV